MFALRFLRLPAFAGCFCLLAAPALAQSSPGQWVDGLYSVRLPYSESGSVCLLDYRAVSRAIPMGTPPERPPMLESIDPEDGLLCPIWRGDALYALGCAIRPPRGAGGGAAAAEEKWIFFRLEGGEWQPLGAYKTRCREPIYAIPCNGGRFILITHCDLADDGEPDQTPFSIVSMPDGKNEMRLVRSIGHGQDGLRQHVSDRDIISKANFSRIIATGSHAVLVHEMTGLYWVFSMEKASLVKAGNIFRKVTPEMIAKGGFHNAILCANPEKEGTVLISALDENLFISEVLWQKDYSERLAAINRPILEARNDLELVGRKLEESMPQRIELEKWRQKMEKEFDERNTYIAWYRLYPETGRVERLMVPPEGGAEFREGGKNDVWRPMPDGSVLMGWDESMIRAQEPKTEQGGEAAGGDEARLPQATGAPPETDAPPPQPVARARAAPWPDRRSTWHHKHGLAQFPKTFGAPRKSIYNFPDRRHAPPPFHGGMEARYAEAKLEAQDAGDGRAGDDARGGVPNHAPR